MTHPATPPWRGHRVYEWVDKKDHKKYIIFSFIKVTQRVANMKTKINNPITLSAKEIELLNRLGV